MNDTEKKGYLSDLLKKTGDDFRAGAAKEHAEMAGRTPTPQEHVPDYPGDEPLPSSKTDKAWTKAEIEADPDGYFDAHVEQFKKQNPGLSAEAIRAQWKYASNLMGYAPLGS